MTAQVTIRIQEADFDITREIAALTKARTDIGAVVSFSGICRDSEAGEAGEVVLPSTTLIGIVLLWLSAIFTIYTGWDYLRAGIHHLIKEDEG